MAYISDNCIEPIREILIGLVNTTLRKYITEVKCLSLVLEALRGGQPQLSSVIDDCLDKAYHSEDIKQNVEKQIGSILKVLNAIDKANADQVMQDLWRQLNQTQTEN